MNIKKLAVIFFIMYLLQVFFTSASTLDKAESIGQNRANQIEAILSGQ